MADYKSMYFKLFSSITDTLNAMENSNFGDAREILIKAQVLTEEMYMDLQGEEE